MQDVAPPPPLMVFQGAYQAGAKRMWAADPGWASSLPGNRGNESPRSICIVGSSEGEKAGCSSRRDGGRPRHHTDAGCSSRGDSGDPNHHQGVRCSSESAASEEEGTSRGEEQPHTSQSVRSRTAASNIYRSGTRQQSQVRRAAAISAAAEPGMQNTYCSGIRSRAKCGGYCFLCCWGQGLLLTKEKTQFSGRLYEKSSDKYGS